MASLCRLFLLLLIMELNKIGFAQVVCGGIFTNETGTITSPNYPGNYDNNLICTWRIVPPLNGRVHLYFSAFDIEVTDGCRGDKVTIQTDDSRVFGPACNETDKFSVVPNPGPVNITFLTDRSGNATGFELKWIVCGGIFESTEGMISSPVFQIEIPDFICVFQIVIPVNLSAVEVHFEETSFQDANGGCLLAIQNILFPSGNSFNCTNPRVVISDRNNLMINLTMKRDFTPRLNATFRKYDCDQVLTSTSGTIQSPYYPERFDRDSLCRISIGFSIPDQYVVIVDFNDTLLLCEGPENLQIINSSLNPCQNCENICRDSTVKRYFMNQESVVQFSSFSDNRGNRFSANYFLEGENADTEVTTQTQTDRTDLEEDFQATLQPQTDATVAIAAGASGAAFVIIVLLVVGVIFCLKRRKLSPSEKKTSDGTEEKRPMTRQTDMSMGTLYTDIDTESKRSSDTGFRGEYVEVSNEKFTKKNETKDDTYQTTKEGEYDLLHTKREKEKTTDGGNIYDVTQTTKEGEYDLVHTKREKEKATEGSNIYDVTQPETDMYGDARVKAVNQNEEDMYDHAKAFSTDENTYDTTTRK